MTSSTKTIKCGVPQGSVLGPTLFTIYNIINDIVYASYFTTRLFADDTALILSDTNLTTLEMKVKSEMQKIVLWLNENKLTLNYSKTTYLLVDNALRSKDKRKSSFSVSINNTVIEKASAAKYLRIIIEPTLKWNLQFSRSAQNSQRLLGLYQRYNIMLTHQLCD